MPKKLGNIDVIMIGDDFQEGSQANADIDYLLGYNTINFEERAIRSEKYGCSESPNYCEDIELVQTELAKLKVNPTIIPVENTKTHTKLFTATFCANGEQYLTRPFETDTLALACVLWYVFYYLK